MMKILAVDDDELILELLVESLRASGFSSVQTATSANAAARLISTATEPFDCFLLDVVMPEVDGIALTRWIRKSPLYGAAPIVMITSMAEKAFIDRAFRAGATDYVTKPFDAVEVTTRVQLAARQVQANRAVHDAGMQVQALRAKIDAQHHTPLSEPVALNDVEGLIDFLALQNYLLQLSRGSFLATSVVALRIVDVGNIYARCSPALFRDVLADVAESALGAMSGSQCIMAYTGNGTFAGVVACSDRNDFEDVELMINLTIERLELVDDQQRPLEVRVAMGTPRAIGVMQSGRAAVAKMHRAIEDISWNMPQLATLKTKTKRGAGMLLRALTQAI
ncbi:response regulator transcription factor [Fuscibacter oryzae]|uniref:Response regulator n=1 Tax=Fuscibacter oryzae TaxID=2803939 RepID=A0A8J7SX13_9RHOB|nr:response regulator [Fuscibacter oryzae]MBL4929499.1 response regulator [Fuscibacter oryzae]